MSTSELTVESAEVVTDKATHPLILSGKGYGLEISPAFLAKKAELLKASAVIAEVNNPEDDAIAAKMIEDLASMRIITEKGRKEVKRPAIDFGLKVDQDAATFVADLVSHEARLKKARGDYATAVMKERQRVLDEMEAKRKAEEKRLADEAAAAAKIEADRIAAEQAAWEATTPEDEAAAAKAAEEAKAAELKRLEEVAKVITAPATVAFVPAVPKGVKFEWDFEVTDSFALYQHNAGLVDLVPKRAAILERIKGMAVGDDAPVIPGLKITKVAKVASR